MKNGQTHSEYKLPEIIGTSLLENLSSGIASTWRPKVRLNIQPAQLLGQAYSIEILHGASFRLYTFQASVGFQAFTS